MAETLCFIDNDENFFSVRSGFVKEMNEMNQKITLALKGFIDVECLGDEIVEIEFLKTWISDHGDQGLVVKTFQQAVDQCCFPGSNIAGKQQKATVVVDAVFQHGQGFFVGFTQPQELGIRTDSKGFHLEIEMRKIHVLTFIKTYQDIIKHDIVVQQGQGIEHFVYHP